MKKNNLSAPTQAQIDKRLNDFNRSDVPQEVVDRFLRLHSSLKKAGGSDPLVLIRKLYNFVDYYMERVVNRHTACSKGCGYCCRVPLSVSSLEAAYVDFKTKKNKRIATLVPDKNRIWIPRDSVDDYCPLFDDETASCSQYEVRPLHCRVFASIDSWENCVSSETPHMIYGLDSNRMLQIIGEYLDQLNYGNGYSGYPDIRDWFTKK